MSGNEPSFINKDKSSKARSFIGLLSMLALYSCGSVKSDKEASTFTIQNDSSELSSRLTIKDQVLNLSSSNINLASSYTLTLIGELNAPVLDNQTLQATDVYTDGGFKL